MNAFLIHLLPQISPREHPLKELCKYFKSSSFRQQHTKLDEVLEEDLRINKLWTAPFALLVGRTEGSHIHTGKKIQLMHILVKCICV